MLTKEALYELAVGAIKGTMPMQFSNGQTNSEALRQALIEANGGKDTISIKQLYRGNMVFDLIEAIIPVMIDEGLRGDEFFNNLVEYRNRALGDDFIFRVERPLDDILVAKAGYGTMAIRRQRLAGMENVEIPTYFHVAKVYDELKRFLAGRITLQELINRVSTAFIKQIRVDIYDVFAGISNSNQYGLGDVFVPVAGTYNEENLFQMCVRVEAVTGTQPVITGTKAALRKVTTAIVSNEAKDSMYNVGYFGKFNGYNMVYVPQIAKPGTDGAEMLLDDKKLYIMGADQRPIKVVNVGEGIASTTDPLQTADNTLSYFYGQEYGIGVIFSQKMGIYTMS